MLTPISRTFHGFLFFQIKMTPTSKGAVPGLMVPLFSHPAGARLRLWQPLPVLSVHWSLQGSRLCLKCMGPSGFSPPACAWLAV